MIGLRGVFKSRCNGSTSVDAYKSLMVAMTLKSSVRPADVVIRWGGEELVVVISGNINKEKLTYIAGMIRFSFVEKTARDGSLLSQFSFYIIIWKKLR